MKTFAFILFVLNPTGEYGSFVIDYNLTESDCAKLRAQWEPTIDQYSAVACEVEK